MSSMLTSMIATMNLTDKVTLNQLLAVSIANDIGAGTIAPAAAVKAKSDKPKRAAAPGVLAWNAFVKHCKTSQPALFEGVGLEKDRLAICGGIKEKDTPAYEAWVAEFIKTLPSPSIASENITPPSSDSEETTKPKKEKSTEQKAADKEKRKQKADAKKASAAAAPAPAATAAPAATSQEGDMVKKTIKGKPYLMDPGSSNLYSTDSKFESLGDYVGKFNASNTANPIDFDAEE